MSVLTDSSGAAAAEGLKIHVISTGGVKGGGVPGTEITDEMLDEVQEMVDGIGEVFFEAVAKGRRLSLARVKTLTDGRLHIAAKAPGLVDAVEPFEAAASALIWEARPKVENGRRISPEQRAAYAKLAKSSDSEWVEDQMSKPWFERAMGLNQ